MEKAEGAFLTISELSGELGLPQHILRYWETRFPQLRPLQRSGNRRYYRPADVALVRRINQLLNVEGFTVRGAQKALAEGVAAAKPASSKPAVAPPQVEQGSDVIDRLQLIRTALARAIGE
jgi:DNA-binding transcriptional MerR regulator